MSEGLTCGGISEILTGFSLIVACDTLPDGSLRMATQLNYPNGSPIDVFLCAQNDLFHTLTLSDYGQTVDYLDEMGFGLFGTKKRRELVEEICETYGVTCTGTVFELEIGLEEVADLPLAILRLAQACLRITDLLFTQRLSSFTTFKDEIEEYLAEQSFLYSRDPTDIIGKWHKSVAVDFRVEAAGKISLVQTWSTRTTSGSHPQAAEIFTRWYDLESQRHEYQFITVFDDEAAQFRNEDFSRLLGYSSVFGFPHQKDELTRTLGGPDPFPLVDGQKRLSSR